MTNPLTPEELQAMREIWNATSSRNWRGIPSGFGVTHVLTGGDSVGTLIMQNNADSQFVIRSHNEWPRLIDEVERLQRAYSELQRTHEEYVSQYGIC